MTAIDRAFIRAYSDDPMPSGPVAPPREFAAVSAETSARLAPAATRAAPNPPAARTPVASAPAPSTVPRPHANFSPLPQRHFVERTSVSSENAPGHFDGSLEALSTLESSPLRHGITSVSSPNDSLASESRETLRIVRSTATATRSFAQRAPLATDRPKAAYEVDAFVWSPVCDRLLATAGAQLEHVGDRLAADLEQRVVAITANRPGIGATTVAQCLARALARAGASVCLIDADFRGPDLTGRLGLNVESGLEKVLSGSLRPAEVMVESLADRLIAVPLAGRMDLAEVEQTKLRQTLTLGQLREQFHVVLIDAGPLEDRASAALGLLSSSAAIDAALVVHDCRASDRHAVRQTCRALDELHVRTLGILENRCA